MRIVSRPQSGEYVVEEGEELRVECQVSSIQRKL